ncbi:MAG TPA: MBL fold metallo-hydrolase [Pseudolabrys sp.]|nr:MBL fold metallo-hydrolase [Pseudolabrys sp.]
MTRHVVISSLLIAGSIAWSPPAHSQQMIAPKVPHPIVLQQVAPDLYFLDDYDSSNAGFLVTDEGVLVIDTRQHPRDGQNLIDRIRKITDKPIKWVVNTHFHGDHFLGNPAFKAIGATIVAHKDTAALMQKTFSKEIARRGKFFESRGYDPGEVTLVLPDVTFDSSMTIRLGGKEIQLLYLGPGQNPGDTFVLIPHDRVIYTPGAFARRSWANIAFTPSVESWIKLLNEVASKDVDKILPPHGEVATRADVVEMAKFIADEYAEVKEAVAKGMSADDAAKTLTFPQYKDYKNYHVREHDIRSLYNLIKTGKSSYFD